MNIFLLEDDIMHQQRLELVIREILLEKTLASEINRYHCKTRNSTKKSSRNR